MTALSMGAGLGLALVAAGLAAAARAEPPPASPSRDQVVAQFVRWTHMPARAVVSVTPEIAVALVGRGTAAAGHHIEGVELQGEVLDEDLAQSRGWRSMRLTLDLACADGGTRARKMMVYAGHDRSGAAREAPTPMGWIQPKSGAYLEQVVGALCGTASATAAAGPVPSPPAAAPARPTPTAAQIRLRPAQTDITPPSAVIRAPARPAAAGLSVQLAATPDAAAAEAAKTPAIVRLIGARPGLAFRVEPSQVSGRQVYRATVSGFAGRDQARNFCAAARAAGGDCLVR